MNDNNPLAENTENPKLPQTEPLNGVDEILDKENNESTQGDLSDSNDNHTTDTNVMHETDSNQQQIVEEGTDVSYSQDGYEKTMKKESEKNPYKGIMVASALTAVIVGSLSGYMSSAFSGHNQTTVPSYSQSVITSDHKQSEVNDLDYVSWEKVVKSVADSVVSITTKAETGAIGYGSGAIVSKDGLILTNDHVIDKAQSIMVTLNDGSIFEATVRGTDPSTDLAVLGLKNSPKNLVPATFGDSEEVLVGESVLAMGNPLGLSQTATTGIVSALNRPVTTSKNNEVLPVSTNAIQIDAAVNPGNSGGPLFNAQGEIIGITSSIAIIPDTVTPRAGSIGLGFAIPSNQAAKISNTLIKNGEIKPSLLGVHILTEIVSIDNKKRFAAKVEQVSPKSPMSNSGIKKGDHITKFNGKTVNGAQSLKGFVKQHEVNDEITITYVSSGQEKTTKVKIGENSITETPVTPEIIDE